MFKLFLSIFCICFFIRCKDDSNKINYIESAEMNIINSDYKTALTFYSKADNILSIDCYNALTASVKIEDWKQAHLWSKKLVKRGVKKKYFLQNKFKKFINSKEWKHFNKNYNKYRNSFLESFDKSLLNKIKYFLNKDQEVYCSSKSGQQSYVNQKDRTLSLDDELQFLFENNKINEKTIGANVKNDTILLPYPTYYVLLRHSFQTNSKLIKYFESNIKINKLMKKDVFLNLKNNPGDKNVIYKINNKFFESSKSDKNNEEYLDYKRKLIYNLCNPKSDFILYAPYVTLNFKNNSKEDILKSFYKPFNFDCE